MATSATEDSVTPVTPTRASLPELRGVVCVCTPAKPVWSEVIVFRGSLLRRGNVNRRSDKITDQRTKLSDNHLSPIRVYYL